MGLKLNPATVMIGGFVGLSVAAGALLVREPGATAQTLPTEIDQANFAKAAPARPAAPAPAPPAKPRDERFVIKRVLPITGPIRYGEFHWDETGVPDGPLVMTVDLEARVLSVFRGGYEIGATAVLLGTQEKPTPLGVFPVIWKKADHYSSIYDGAPMPYTLRLTNDGISIHGTKVEKGYASHGCVGVPTPFAKKLFAVAKLGDQVYITRGKRIGKGDSLTGA
ncbi:L,D-transpeptidase family protein [Novosphingobium arvoryzae]|uniref:L,D-transpeptidase family protein n=1 Tax=Novosphingobium arvoryzae TaxID=1256514 RepID=UPI0035B4733C